MINKKGCRIALEKAAFKMKNISYIVAVIEQDSVPNSSSYVYNMVRILPFKDPEPLNKVIPVPRDPDIKVKLLPLTVAFIE